jgi:hypothetical protein
MKNLLIIPFLILTMNCFAPGYLEIYIPSIEPLKKSYTLAEKIQALIDTETSNGVNRYNPGETDAVGLLQIHSIMVREVNRILGYQKYQLSDRLSDKASIDIFLIYQRHYNPTMEFQKMARLWCSGPDGMRETNSLGYYNRALTNLYNS